MRTHFCFYKKSHRNRGFTLIEVLVAMAISAIIGVLAYKSLTSAMNAVELSQQKSQRLNDINTFFSIFSKDVRQLVARPVRNENGEMEPALVADEKDAVALRLTRTGWQNPRPEVFVRSQLQRVHYQLEGKELVRESFYVIDRADDELEPIRSELLDKVTSLKFRFMIQPKRGSSNETLEGEWSDSWPPRVAGNIDGSSMVSALLPAVLEVKIELEDWGEIRRVYDLVLNDPAEQVQGGGN